MIVKGDKVEQEVIVSRATDAESILSNPPPYSARSDGPSSSSVITPASSGPAVPPPSASRCNFLTIRRDNSSIKGDYIIDPQLQIPAELLAPLEDGETESGRPNLALRSQNASITADVWVESGVDEDSPVGAGDTKRPVIIDIKSHNGSATVKLTADLLVQPVKIKVMSYNGSASLVLPSTFTGPLMIGTKNGGINVSDMIQGRSTTFSDVKGMRSCFVGDFKRAGFGDGEWQGSSVHVESHNGRVKILFSEEVVDYKRGPPSFFAKWFSGASSGCPNN